MLYSVKSVPPFFPLLWIAACYEYFDLVHSLWNDDDSSHGDRDTTITLLPYVACLVSLHEYQYQQSEV